MMFRLGLASFALILCATAFTPSRSPRQTVRSESASRSLSTKDDDLTTFQVLAGNVVNCLVQSDIKRRQGNDGASAGWTSWVDEGAAFRLKNCMDKIAISSPAGSADPTQVELLQKRDDAQRWTRWMKNTPTPLMIEMSDELRKVVNETIDDETLELIESTRQDFLDRVGCRLVLLPSGKELLSPIRTPAGAMAYGKLLYGGVTRFRLIGSNKNKRRAGERTEIYNSKTVSWMQYGGPERKYVAVEMGPCALVECLILPKGVVLQTLDEDGSDMTVSNLGWDPRAMLDFVPDDDNDVTQVISDNETMLVDGNNEFDAKNHVQELESSFSSKIGGLSDQVDAIVRRVLDGRVIRPASGGDSSDAERQKEAETLLELGLEPVKGLLLYGPPGCGKTKLAREISVALDARPAKIVSAPELLDRWVGGSEKLVRGLFAEAEQELKACNNDPTKSALHVIVIDEIDAVFRKRSSNEDSAAATRASAVNQILSLLDGVNAPGNILVIGMTNRRELLDDALLRPGRLEVQVKIPLPTREGRREILQIHFDALRRKGRLSQPLCQALDGASVNGNDARQSFWRRRLKSVALSGARIKDLAEETRGYSGADIAGLVRSAGSLALSRARQDGGGVDSLLITVEDVAIALQEVA